MKNSIKREQSQKGLNSAERENFSTSCKKYIYILNAVSVMAKLLKDKRIEGVLYIDQNTGKLTFKAYNRQSREREKDRLRTRESVRQLPQGLLYGADNRVDERTQPGRKECAH